MIGNRGRSALWVQGRRSWRWLKSVGRKRDRRPWVSAHCCEEEANPLKKNPSFWCVAGDDKK
jgi:hypothetical protein